MSAASPGTAVTAREERAIREALAELPAQCRYHGASIEGRDLRRFDGACCATGQPSLRRRRAETALDALTASTDAWFGAWECGCSDTERSPLGIPEFCPVHGRNLISNFAGSTKVQLNHSGVSGYGFKAGPA